MADAITKGISRALKAEFSELEGLGIAAGPVRQGLVPPRFFVICREAKQKAYPSRRFLAENAFEVVYLPADKLNAREACAAAARRLFSCLAVIDAGFAALRGTKMRWETKDGALHFFVQYNYFFRVEENAERMEELALGVRGG